MASFYQPGNTQKDFSQVFIIPQYSEITSRKTVDTSVEFLGLKLDIPIISANMDTVTGTDVAIEMHRNGAIGAMHRFMSINKNVLEYQTIRSFNREAFVSIGVNEESKQRAKALYEHGARYFIIDIAHGHSLLMRNMIEWLRAEFRQEIKIVAGNVATPDGAVQLAIWGADAVKVGVGPGSVCITKNQTGVTFPQFSAVGLCAAALREYNEENETNVACIADGGLYEYGDIAKAIAIGADIVMSGRFFATTKEAPGKRTNGQKEYRGMASKEAMATIKREEDMATPEGKSIMLTAAETTVADVLKDIKGALQSSMSYSGSANIKEFQEKTVFGFR